jgi:hypothetical protein
MSPKLPGFLLVRVPRQINGKPIDRNEARQTLRRKPWFAELQHVGTDVRWHVFARPDTNGAAETRRTSAYDHVAALTRLSGGRRK